MNKNIKFSEHPTLSFLFCHCEERSDAAIPSFHCIFHLSLSLQTFEESVAISILLHIYHLYLSFILNSHLNFFIISSRTYNPNPLLLYKLNTKYKRLTTDFNSYMLFLCANLHFPNNKLFIIH